MSIYWGIVALCILFGMIMPQEGPGRKYYVALMTLIHWFVCAFRYQFLTGDLRKYYTTFWQLSEVGYMDEMVVNGWKNTGFYWMMKFVGQTSNMNFQILLIILAVFTCLTAGILIYRYSPKPWMSFVVWNCLGFYVTYDYLALKQGVAMAFLMLSMMYIFEKKPFAFLFWTVVASSFHMPSLCFLPAYFLANRRLNGKMLAFYVAVAVVIFFSRNQIIDVVGELYYEDTTFTLAKEELGGRTIVIILMLVVGLLLKGFREKRFSQLFNLIVAAAIVQMFSGFNHVFTRLADYYLQFAVLYIPSIFFDNKNTEIRRLAAPPVFPFNRRSRNIFAACIVLILIWWYDTTMLGHTNSYEVDNFLNYRFMWDVK